MYFVADNGITGVELWKSDGTNAGTILVKDINTGINSSYPGYITFVNGVIYFIANTDTNGEELYKTDGTATGTILVKDINIGISGSNPRNLIALNNMLYFVADDGTTGSEIWKSNGTSVGTVLVADLTLIGDGDISLHTTLDNVLLFTQTNDAVANELYKYVVCPVVVTNTTLASGTVGSAYSATLTQTGLISPTWAVISGLLPAGLAIIPATGVILGTPTSVGTTTFTVEATGQSCSKTQILNIIVDKGNQTIVFGALPAKNALDTSFPITAIGGASGNNVTFSSSNASVATISGNIVTITGDGTTNITASQAGNANYNDATSVVQTLTVTNTVTSLANIKNSIKISPNPSTGAFSIDFGGAVLSKSVINIYNVQGKKVRSIDVNGDIVSISLENESNGVYFVEISGASNTIYRKIVKNK